MSCQSSDFSVHALHLGTARQAPDSTASFGSRRRGWAAKVDPMVFAALPRVAMGIAQERRAMGEARYVQSLI